MGRGGFASLEPPDKMSTGHFSPLDKFDKSNFLLIRIHKIKVLCKIKGEIHIVSLTFGGKGWIRTTEVADDRFTVCSLWPLGNLPKTGAGDWNRTRNLLITNQLLCQLSYTSDKLGASGRNRTTDTGIFSPLLYLLSYRGIQVVFLKMLAINTSIFVWRPGRGSNPRPPA